MNNEQLKSKIELNPEDREFQQWLALALVEGMGCDMEEDLKEVLLPSDDGDEKKPVAPQNELA